MIEFRIETPRLVLRAWREDDFAAYLALRNDARVMEFMGPFPAPEEARKKMQAQIDSQNTHGFCHWVIEELGCSGLIGTCGLKLGPDDSTIADKLEIGWQLAVDHWGKGYAFEAAQATLNWGWENQHEQDIWAITVPDNVRSLRLMERLGMRHHPEMDFERPDPEQASATISVVTYGITPR